MRSQVISNIAIHYPDKVAMCFNPCICQAVSTGTATPAYTETECDGHKMRIIAYGGKAVWDMRELLQLAVRNNVRAGGMINWNVSYTIKVYGAQDTLLATLTATSFVVWGALRHGETYNAGRRMAYFPGWPFDFGLYLDGHSGKLLVKNDRRPDGLINITPSEGLYKFQLPTTAAPAKERYEIYDFQGTLTQLTFDNSFDLTFRYRFNGTMTKVLDIDVMQSNFEHPVYLRWIDRHGFTVYWLFKQGDEKREVKAIAEFMRDNMREVGSGSSVGEPFDRRLNYQRQDTLTLCSPLVDRAQFDLLQDLTSSPSVDRYDKATGEWEAVTVKDGTYTKTPETLQDFVVYVTLAEMQTQSL